MLYKIISIFSIFFALSQFTFAKSVAGFNQNSINKVSEIQTTIERYKEYTKDEILISFGGYPSFYRFSLQKLTFSKLKDFLDERVKKQKEVLVKFDPISTQIFSIEDLN